MMTAITHNIRSKKPILPHPGYRSKIALPTAEGLRFERIAEICYLEAAGNYTFLHFRDGSRLLVCRSLQELQDRLAAPHCFLRIHRSTVINLDYLDRYVRGKGGYVILEGGASLAVSNSRRPAFLEDLDRYFK
jgi:two-component system, LytTR family, response regulator